jgi:hypothetical protein
MFFFLVIFSVEKVMSIKKIHCIYGGIDTHITKKKHRYRCSCYGGIDTHITKKKHRYRCACYGGIDTHITKKKNIDTGVHVMQKLIVHVFANTDFVQYNHGHTI